MEQYCTFTKQHSDLLVMCCYLFIFLIIIIWYYLFLVLALRSAAYLNQVI